MSPEPKDLPRPSLARSSAIRGSAFVLFAIGLVARIAPLFDRGGRLYREFTTEDGYLMLTIARNLAMGRGMSVSNGEVPTNGTQPLATFLYTLGYLPSGDKWWGVFFAHVLQIGFGIGTAYGIHRLARKVVAEERDPEAVALLASSTWFASALFVTHSMNCLETGLYALFVVAVANAFADVGETAPWAVRRSLGIGVLLGLSFWARNDAIFLIAAACLTYVAVGRTDDTLKIRFRDTLVFGSTSVAVALPWIANNVLRFGHPVPVSGRAERLNAAFGENLRFVPGALFEHLTLFLQIPQSIEHKPIVAIALVFPIVAYVALLVRARPAMNVRERTLLTFGLLYAAGLVGYYGFFFGAWHFVSRYLFPLSPLLAVSTVTLALAAWRGLRERLPDALGAAVLVGAVALIGAYEARIYAKGTDHMHMHVVAWVRANVPDDVWIGAIQTGTIGYFHDRTLNLDGKVSLAAYEGHVHHRIGAYIRDSRIQYMPDWMGMLDFLRLPEVDESFEVLVDDPAHNLAVLVRRGLRPHAVSASAR